jgi:hypothetical protein
VLAACGRCHWPADGPCRSGVVASQRRTNWHKWTVFTKYGAADCLTRHRNSERHSIMAVKRMAPDKRRVGSTALALEFVFAMLTGFYFISHLESKLVPIFQSGPFFLGRPLGRIGQSRSRGGTSLSVRSALTLHFVHRAASRTQAFRVAFLVELRSSC